MTNLHGNPVRKSVLKALTFISKHFRENLTLDQIAAEAGITKYGLCSAFRSEFNLTPMQWLWTFRVSLACELMKLRPSKPLHEIGTLCGFNSAAHFSRKFKEVTGLRPSA